MNQVIAERTVITRKPHRCFGCAGYFPPKTKMLYWVGITEGDFNQSYWCMRCNDFLKTLSHEDIGDGFYMGDIFNFPDYPKTK